MSGLIGKKIGMTSVFDNQGRHIPVTVVEVDTHVITQIKTSETDGYNAVQLAAFDRKEKNVSKAVKGHLAKAGTTAKKEIREFRDMDTEGLTLGDELNVADIFTIGDLIDVVGTSKGRGFTGVIKRHNFAGVGDATHGQHNRLRAPGSIGGASDPARVFKGMKMAGQHGNARVKMRNLSVANVLPESNTILVTGAIPGPNGGYVEIHNKSSVI